MVMAAHPGATDARAGTIAGGAEGTNMLRMIGETNAFRTAAQVVAEQSPELRDNDLYFHDGKVTEAGILKASQDAGLAKPQSFGDLNKEEKALGGLRKAITLDGNGAVTGTSLEGRTSSAYHMDQLAKFLDANNLHKSAAGVRRMEEIGNGFDFTLSTDAAGHVTGFQASAGGHTLFQDRAEENTLDSRKSGRENIYRNVNSVEAGTFITTGYKHEDFNQNVKHGAYMMNLDGKEMLVQGNLYYDKAGHLIGGTVENGLNESVLAYKMDKAGNLHFAHVTGKADTHGNLVAGRATEITEQEFVRRNSHGLAVVTSRGAAGQPDVDVHGSGGVKMDQSSTHTFFTRVESKQNLAGSAAQGAGFGKDGNIDPGAAATYVAIGQGALHETGETINDVKNISKALRDPETVIGGPGKEGRAAAAREAGREEARAATESTRAQQVRVQQTTQKTARVLQNQSRTSQVPHGRTMPRPAPSSVRPGISKPNIKLDGGKPTPKP
jgi:conjugal transfer mating pair stabilization protein TraG